MKVCLTPSQGAKCFLQALSAYRGPPLASVSKSMSAGAHPGLSHTGAGGELLRPVRPPGEFGLCGRSGPVYGPVKNASLDAAPEPSRHLTVRFLKD